MIRRWLSNFLKVNKGKFKDVGVKLIIVAIVVFIATIIVSFNGDTSNTNKSNKDVYTPKETIIKGSDVSEKQYIQDNNIVQKFLEYCNNGQAELAYGLISDDCKEAVYSSLEIFKNSYCDIIFKEKREYNLQSWVSTNKYTVYKIRYTTNMLATGKYEEDNVYEDYITLMKNSDSEKISIGNFVTLENLNKTTNTDEIEATVLKKYIALDYEEYEIKITNKTENTILLDTLENNDNIRLVGSEGGVYRANVNRIFKTDLKIDSQKSNTIIVRFKKEISSNNKSEAIKFLKIIKNYDIYNSNKENYDDTFSIKIRL